MRHMLMLLRNISLHIVAVSAVGQNPGKTPPEKTAVTEPMTNSAINQRLAARLGEQVPETKNVHVNWNVSRYGYVATYVIENVSYLTLYNTAGELIETFRKLPWDDRVPDIIRLEFDNSEYSSFTVIGFWEGVREENRHYFLQMLDKESVSWNVWSDETGKFSTAPFIE